MKYYPQLLTAIVEHACPDLLRTLRLVSRWSRLEVDARLVRHFHETDYREGTRYLDLPLDSSPRIMSERGKARVIDWDSKTFFDWHKTLPDKDEKTAVAWPEHKLLIRYFMEGSTYTVCRGHMWRPARRSVHFVDMESLHSGLRARAATYAQTGESGSSVVFHVRDDLGNEDGWYTWDTGVQHVQRVHNRGLTLVFSCTDTWKPSFIPGRPHPVVLHLLDRIVEDYAETGDSATVIGVEDWLPELVPRRGVHNPITEWTERMSNQAKVEWWAEFKAHIMPEHMWARGNKNAPRNCIRFLSFAEWKEELGEQMYDLIMDSEAIYWGA